MVLCVCNDNDIYVYMLYIILDILYLRTREDFFLKIRFLFIRSAEGEGGTFGWKESWAFAWGEPQAQVPFSPAWPGHVLEQFGPYQPARQPVQFGAWYRASHTQRERFRCDEARGGGGGGSNCGADGFPCPSPTPPGCCNPTGCKFPGWEATPRE